MKHIESSKVTIEQDKITLRLLKKRLTGSNLRNLRISKNLTKYGIARDCGVTYRTVLNWEQEKVEPSDENTIILARYLGLIKPSEADRHKLKKEIDELNAKLQRLGNG